MRVYVAGSSKEIPVAQAAMHDLRERGHVVTYDWTQPILDRVAAGLGDKDLTDDEARATALLDLEGVQRADALWLLIPEGSSDGAWFELGYAYCYAMSVAPRFGYRIVASGRHAGKIFLRLPHVQCFGDHLSALATFPIETAQQEIKFAPAKRWPIGGAVPFRPFLDEPTPLEDES